MIVDKARRLHVRVNDRGPDEFETAGLKVFAQSVGLRACCGNLVLATPTIHYRLAIDEPPDISVETSEFALDLQERPRIADRCCNFESVSDYARVIQQSFYGAPIEARDSLRIKVCEGLSVTLSLSQNSGPTQTSLGTLE
jgi:hypothetical protein